MRRRVVGVAVAVIGCLSGCAHTVVVSQSLAEMERARAAPTAADAATLAPQAWEHAEQERALAREADRHRDEAAADLHAERALAAYDRTVVLARLARATSAGEAARVALAKETDEASRLAAARAEFEHTADATAADLSVAREATATAHVGPADATRELARLVAARSLAAEAHLLCGAARLLPTAAGSPETTRLDAAAHDLEDVKASLASLRNGHGSPLEAAASARAACLDAITHVRRARGGGSAGDADALLSALSARGGWAPSRDERGVVITLRSTWKGGALSTDAERDLRELGRVAAIHPTFPVQLVVHDAAQPTAAERALDTQRLKAAVAALRASLGSSGPAVATETMGASVPVTDPSDARGRARNARLDIVFVSPTD